MLFYPEGVHRPAKANSGWSSLRANHIGVLRGLASAKRRDGDDAAISPAQPSSPMRTVDVANVRDRRASELGWSGHSPTRHDKLALAVGADPDDRRDLIPGRSRGKAAGCPRGHASRGRGRERPIGLRSGCRGCAHSGDHVGDDRGAPVVVNAPRSTGRAGERSTQAGGEREATRLVGGVRVVGDETLKDAHLSAAAACGQ